LFGRDQGTQTALLIRLLQTLDYCRADVNREVMFRIAREGAALDDHRAAFDDAIGGTPLDEDDL
jgi:hypothetical protein